MDLAGSDFGADFGPQVPPWFLCPRTRDALDKLNLKEKASPPPGTQIHPPRVHAPPNFSTLPMRVTSGDEQPKTTELLESFQFNS